MDVDDFGPPSGASGTQWQPQEAPNAALNYALPNDGRKLLDIVFIQDCTGSQGSYIASATRNIEEIYSSIYQSEHLASPDDLRIGLIAFRDHPPQDHTYITKNFGFQSDPKRIQDYLKSLHAAGGGDGPEAVTAALGEALEMPWRPTASKMVVLIADAPPHGIGEYGDGFQDGSPDGRDPLQIARQMAQRGITLFFVACEPALSGYQHATDFYQAITGITSGLMLPLTTADLLAHAIVGSVLENLDMERIIREVGEQIAARILGGNESVDDVARELHERLLLRNENTKKVVVEDIYRESEEAKHNVNVFTNAPDLASARPLLKKVRGPRFTDKYLKAAGSRRPFYSSSSASFASRSRPPAAGITPPSSPPSSGPISPSRRVVTDFKPFGAPAAAAPPSVFGTKVEGGSSMFGPRPSAFAGIRDARGPRGGLFEEDEEDDGGQKIELRQGSITLDQAKRIALQSAWRGLGS